MPKARARATKGNVPQPAEQHNGHPAEEHYVEDTGAVRISKFKEGTMNSTSAIMTPPDELWKGLAIDDMIERFNEDDKAPATVTTMSVLHKKTSTTSRAASSAHTSSHESSNGMVNPGTEGTLGRFSRALVSWLNGAGASLGSLGKRKAGSENAERAGDERKKQVEEAYRQAKEQGLLPTPKVFVRPVSRTHKANGKSGSHRALVLSEVYADLTAAGLPLSGPATPISNGIAGPRTPALYKTPSKHDLHKQKKLSKRVSDLEFKLREARKELTLALGPHNPNVVPPMPSNNYPPTPKTDPIPRHAFAAVETPPHDPAVPAAPATFDVGKIIKKRRVMGDSDYESKQVTTDSDYSVDSSSESKTSKRTSPKKLTRKKSIRNRQSIGSVDEAITVIPDGQNVPSVPNIPSGVPGRRVAVNEDGYGGYEHEMF